MALFQRKETDFGEQKTTTDHSGNLQNSADPSGASQGDFGVGDLVKLFYSLPQKNLDAEIDAVVRTITSFDVNVQQLIDEILQQENLAYKRLKVLELEIQLFKAKIKTRQKEMDLLHMGVDELNKSQGFLQQGLQSLDIQDNAFSQRVSRKRASKLSKVPKLDQLLPLTERIKLAASEEIEQINKQSKIQSLRSKFKKRFSRQ